jgi:CelD/BcsL family acetyltransferase involved in cellulose biosynthesis
MRDFDIMVELNMERFGSHSYFYDRRFLESFRALARMFQEKGWLRFTTVLIKDEPAAVDMGCVYQGVYTLLAGGTNSRYLGVAKLINFHHMQRACEERLKRVDFLCGDFNWKKLFHLTPRPLYLMTNIVVKAA